MIWKVLPLSGGNPRVIQCSKVKTKGSQLQQTKLTEVRGSMGANDIMEKLEKKKVLEEKKGAAAKKKQQIMEAFYRCKQKH